MNGVLSYIKSYIVLFLILTVLIQMVPKDHLRKYIQFFAQMILVFGLIYPVLNWIGDSDAFLERIQYDTFLQEMEEASLDAEKIAYLDNRYYVEKYEESIADAITQTAEEYNFAVKEISVRMTETYEINRICMTITNPLRENIVIGKVVLDKEDKNKESTEESAYKKLKEKLISYYQLSEEQLDIVCE